MAAVDVAAARPADAEGAAGQPVPGGGGGRHRPSADGGHSLRVRRAAERRGGGWRPGVDGGRGGEPVRPAVRHADRAERGLPVLVPDVLAQAAGGPAPAADPRRDGAVRDVRALRRLLTGGNPRAGAAVGGCQLADGRDADRADAAQQRG
ncbi:hypothetical protein E1182_07090 [Micromonospora sp. KC721]|nr:hypothetical protein E1182_07090 [Micromonospora sp. KC721]